MIEVVFRASNPIEGVSAMAIHEAMEDLGLDLIESPAGYMVHVHNLECDGDLDSVEYVGPEFPK